MDGIIVALEKKRQEFISKTGLVPNYLIIDLLSMADLVECANEYRYDLNFGTITKYKDVPVLIDRSAPRNTIKWAYCASN